LTTDLPGLAGLSTEKFVDRPARVSRSMDTFETCHMCLVYSSDTRPSAALTLQPDTRQPDRAEGH
jgi:hypothetical protein